MGASEKLQDKEFCIGTLSSNYRYAFTMKYPLR